MAWIECAESAKAILQIEVILNHVLKGCSLRAQVSWIIPTQISIALTISPHSLSPSLTSPLSLCQTGKLPSYWSPPTSKHSTPPSSGPGVRAVTKPVGKGKEDTPHWVQLGFEKVKHFSSTKFQPGQQRGDSVLRPPQAHLIRRSAPSPSAFLPILHSRRLSLALEGLSFLIYFKHCCQQFLLVSLTLKWYRIHILRMTHCRGEGQKSNRDKGDSRWGLTV